MITYIILTKHTFTSDADEVNKDSLQSPILLVSVATTVTIIHSGKSHSVHCDTSGRVVTQNSSLFKQQDRMSSGG